MSTDKQLPTFRRSLLLYIQCTGRLRRLLLSVGKKSAIVIQVSVAKEVRTAFFWVIMQRMVVIPYRRFGTINRSHLQGSRNKKKPTLEDGTDRMSRNVGKELTLLAA